MKNIILLWILIMFFGTAALFAEDCEPEANVNECYVVESIIYGGDGMKKISRALRDEAHKMIGAKYSEQTAQELAGKMRAELKTYSVQVKVSRGEAQDTVKVAFETDSKYKFGIGAGPPLYHSKEGFSGTFNSFFRAQDSVFSFGLVSDADTLLERNAGFGLSYEHKKVGTKLLQFRMDFDGYHQSFNNATKLALESRPDVSGVYRARHNFAPSLTFNATPDLTVRGGFSFQRVQFQEPSPRTETAYSGTADIAYQRSFESAAGYSQKLSGRYSLRAAMRALNSDMVYTRHLFGADYALSRNRQLLETRFIAGSAGADAPLFERFSFGNAYTLRGWNKFDVAPLGGSRAIHGSLEYGYRIFRLFYDVGSVWDPGYGGRVRHGLGFGIQKKGFFMSLAFPVRHGHASPVFMIGVRPGGARLGANDK